MKLRTYIAATMTKTPYVPCELLNINPEIICTTTANNCARSIKKAFNELFENGSVSRVAISSIIGMNEYSIIPEKIKHSMNNTILSE